MKSPHPVFADTDSQLRAPDNGMCILLVEDDPVHALIVTLFLERMGAKVVHVADGEQAVAATSEADYSLVLMDYRLPGIDGMEATRRIRHAACVANRLEVPIVALTASAMKHECQSYLDAGMSLVLTKPISMNKLADIVQRLAIPSAPVEDRQPVLAKTP